MRTIVEKQALVAFTTKTDAPPGACAWASRHCVAATTVPATSAAIADFADDKNFMAGPCRSAGIDDGAAISEDSLSPDLRGEGSGDARSCKWSIRAITLPPAHTVSPRPALTPAEVDGTGARP